MFKKEAECKSSHRHVLWHAIAIAWKAKKQSLEAFEDSLFFEIIGKMEPELETFRENVDSWIKQIRREFTEFSDLPSLVSENTDNVQHNYELIYELKDEIEELKQEINALKLIQIISLKQKMNQKAEEQPQA